MPKKQPSDGSDDQDAPPPISFVFTDDEADGKLDAESDGVDAAVIRSLMLLSQSAGHDFVDHQMPPANLLDWLIQASRKEVDGMLIATLRRWHELQDRLSG